MEKLKYSSLIFASLSDQKLREYRVLLSLPNLQRSAVPVADLQDMNVETLVKRKIQKVSTIITDKPFFVEHTALTIDAWKGLPGGLTGVFMQTVGYEGICKMMQAYEERNATVRTVIGYYYQRNEHFFTGTATGTIAHAPRGETDSTWDHIFIPDEGKGRTYAEMGADKNEISMRRKAADDFAKYLSKHYEADHGGTRVLPSPVKPMLTPHLYNVAGIRGLLLAAFTADDLYRFCNDRPDFRPVLRAVPTSPTPNQLVDQMIEYCQNRGIFTELLTEVENERPRMYAKFEPLL